MMSIVTGVAPAQDTLMEKATRSIRRLSDYGISLADQILVSGGNFAIGVLVARLLPLEDFGQFAFVLVMVSFASTVQYFLTTAPLVANAKRDAVQYGLHARLSLMLPLLWGGVVFAVEGATLLLRDGTLHLGIMAAAAAVAIGHSVFDAARFTLFARGKGQFALAIDLARFGMMGALLLAMVLLPQWRDLYVLLYGMALTALLPGLACLIPLMRSPAPGLSQYTAKNWRSGRWLVLMVFATTAFDQIVYLATALMFGDAGMGGLRIGLYCMNLFALILITLEKIVPRHAADIYAAQGRHGLARYLTRTALLSGAPTLAVVLAFAIPAPFWLNLVFGDGADRFAELMRLATAIFALIFLREFGMVYLRTVGKTRKVFASFVVSSLIAPLLLWPLGHAFGLPGMAGAILAAHLISAALIAVHVRLHLRAEPASP